MKAQTKLTNKEIANDVVDHFLNFVSSCNHTRLQLKPIVDLFTGEMEQPQDRMKLWLTSVLDEHRPEPYSHRGRNQRRESETMKWRLVKSAPRPFIGFLGYFSNGECHVVAIDKKGECYRELDPPNAKWMMPTHWMPLPPKPSTPRHKNKKGASHDS